MANEAESAMVGCAGQDMAQHVVALVESASDAIWSESLDGVVVSWNPAAESLLGYAASDIRGRSSAMLVGPDQLAAMNDIRARIRAGDNVETVELVMTRRDGRPVMLRATVSPVRSQTGGLAGFSTIAHDYESAVRHRDELRYLAEHDPLTGVFNRRRFEQELATQLDRAHCYGETSALLVIDVDRLKRINDTHGHTVGDHALTELAAGLGRQLRRVDVLARIGGDEFAVLVPRAGEAEARVIANKVERAARGLIIDLSDESKLCLTASVGYTIIDRNTRDADNALSGADLAMYGRKESAETSDAPHMDPMEPHRA